jgi:hypothetical protein
MNQTAAVPYNTKRTLDTGTKPPEAPVPPTTLGLAELLLKNPERVDQLNRDPSLQGELFPRLLLIGEVGFLVYSLVMVLLWNVGPVRAADALPLRLPPARWNDGTALSLPAAYTLSIVLASCVCLPSFYFYSLLAGVNMRWSEIVSLIAKGTAANGIMLLGVLPIYVAAVLGFIVLKVPAEVLALALGLGLLLPFVSGLWGLWAIYQGVVHTVQVRPEQWRCGRGCFLRRLTLSWAAVYATVVPVMVYRLWEFGATLVQNGM